MLSASTMQIGPLLLLMSASLGLGLLTALVYMYKSTYSGSFISTLVLLPLAVQVVILLVNGNLGIGVSVAGAFSLVRFRSLPGTAREITSLFAVMVIGLATGTGYLGVAVLLDALLVRLLLLPVLLRLAGAAAWAAPTWLGRVLPRVNFGH